MEQWNEIRRRIKVDGASKRSVMRAYGLHFRTLQKVLAHTEPPGYRRREVRPRPKLGPYVRVIEAILEQDKSQPPKQRHTARRIYDRLRTEHGYDGGCSTVREAVRTLRRQTAEVFVPLEHRPGEAQVDFGFGDVEIAGQLRQAAVFVMALPYSGAMFMCGFPRECGETFQQGHVDAFSYFGGVPHRITYDNTKIAVIAVGRGRERTLTREFLRLKSHHLFEHHFCRVRRPNEKGHVEGDVKYGRNNFMVPVPSFDSWAAFNAYLAERCQTDMQRQQRGKDGTIAERLQTDLASFLPLPMQPFEARRIEQTRANTLSLVRFDRNDYSVPTQYAHHAVTAIGGIDTVKLVVDDRLVARHERSWEKEGAFFDPVHYLALLERKPGALDFARPMKDWELPEAFDILRRRLESQRESDGTREYIKVLRLRERVSLPELHRGIELALAAGATDSEAVRLFVEHARFQPTPLFCLDGHPHLKSVHVQNVNLNAYASLVTPIQLEAQP